MSDKDEVDRITIELINGTGVRKAEAKKLSPDARLADFSVSNRIFAEQLSEGYFDRLMSMGIAAGLPVDRVAAKLGITSDDAKALMAQYATEQAKLSEHNKAIKENLMDVLTPRLAKLAVECTERLIRCAEADEMRPTDAAKTLDTAFRLMGDSAKSDGDSGRTGSNSGARAGVSDLSDAQLEELLGAK